MKWIYSIYEILVIEKKHKKKDLLHFLNFYSLEIDCFNIFNNSIILPRLRMKIFKCFESSVFQEQIKCMLVLNSQGSSCTNGWVAANNLDWQHNSLWDLIQCLVENHFLLNIIISIARDWHLFSYHEKKWTSSRREQIRYYHFRENSTSYLVITCSRTY